MASQHLPDRRASAANDPGETPGPEAGLVTSSQDRFLLGARETTRLAMRPRAAIAEPGAGGELGDARRAVAMPPAMGGRRRDVERGSCRPQRHPRLDRLAQSETSSRSESGVSVNLHPG